MFFSLGRIAVISALVALAAPGSAHSLPGLVAPSSPATPSFVVQVQKSCGKYKRDGTGNCLTPAFYKCIKDWEVCTTKCNKNASCVDKCDVKYSQNCGD